MDREDAVRLAAGREDQHAETAGQVLCANQRRRFKPFLALDVGGNDRLALLQRVAGLGATIRFDHRLPDLIGGPASARLQEESILLGKPTPDGREIDMHRLLDSFDRHVKQRR